MPERWPSPFASSSAIHERMSTLARRDTYPELRIRRELHRVGLRYFVHRRPLFDLRREADIVFPKIRLAVFVDGCFWHGCPQHSRRVHGTNAWSWPDKIERNRHRDRDTDERLTAAGWTSLRIWEHEDPKDAAHRVETAVRGDV